MSGIGMDCYGTAALSWVGTILTGNVIAAVSAWITVRLSLRRFQTERTWERKVESYQGVIELLHESGVFFDAVFEADIRGKDLSDEKKDHLSKRSSEAREHLEKKILVLSLFLSKEARNCLRKCLKELESARNTTDWVQFIDGSNSAIYDCINEFSDIAKRDLRIK